MKHLTGINALKDEEIEALLSKADGYADALDGGNFTSGLLKDRIVVNVFFENSTRTRTSFEMAALRLGAKVINWDPQTSSLSKGETFDDTIRTLDALRPDAVIVRHSDFGAPEYMAKIMRCAVVNAGDSWREHPTQALLDALTLRRHFGKLEGLTLAICGDVAHSRVAGSNMILLPRLGVRVRIVAPPALMPQKLSQGIEKFESLDDGLPGCDAVMMLRLQKERMEAGLVKSDAEYFNRYGLTHEKLALANREAVVLHPGPMNRGVEIADDVADDPRRSLILKQVANGVPVRMAVLDALLGGG